MTISPAADADKTPERKQAKPESLDLLKPPSTGRGGRRVSRRSVYIGAGALTLAALAVGYSIAGGNSARLQDNQPSVQATKAGKGAEAPVHPADADRIADAPPENPFEDVQDFPTDGLPADGSYEIPAIDRGQAPPPPPDLELDARLRLKQRVEDGRFAAHEAALGADLQVPGFGKTAPQQSMQGIAPAMAGVSAPMSFDTATPALAGAQPGIAGMAGMPAPLSSDQDHKRAFLATRPAGDVYHDKTRTPARARLEVKAGTVIPGVMISGINSDLPGQITAQVRENVYDTVTGNHLLIPAGARLIGSYDSSVAIGQNRLLVAWQRVIYPDGSSLSLDTMPGTDAGGTAGIRDKVNNHTGKVFGNALLLSAFSAGVTLSQPRSRGSFGGYSAREEAAAELGRNLGQLGMEMARRNLSIQPTIEVRPGARFLVMVNRDIILPEWKG